MDIETLQSCTGMSRAELEAGDGSQVKQATLVAIKWLNKAHESCKAGTCELPLELLISEGGSHVKLLEWAIELGLNEKSSPYDEAVKRGLVTIKAQLVQWQAAAAEATALGLDGSVTFSFWHREIKLPDAFVKCRKFFEIVEKMTAEQFSSRRKAYIDGAKKRLGDAVVQCQVSMPRARRASIERRLLKLGLAMARWEEAYARAVAHAARARPDIANLAAAQWTTAKDRAKSFAEKVASTKQWRRERRKIQRTKRTCSVCAKTVPLSSRALPYYVGDRGVVPRVDRPRYCSEACLRARLEDG